MFEYSDYFQFFFIKSQDSNLTDYLIAFLSAIIGAIFAIIGGFFANKYFQKIKLKTKLKIEWNSLEVTLARDSIKILNKEGTNCSNKETMYQALISKEKKKVGEREVNDKYSQHATAVLDFLKTLYIYHSHGFVNKKFIKDLVGNEPVELLTGIFESYFLKILYNNDKTSFHKFVDFYKNIAEQETCCLNRFKPCY